MQQLLSSLVTFMLPREAKIQGSTVSRRLHVTEGCLQEDLLLTFHSLLHTGERVSHGAEILDLGPGTNGGQFY